MSGWIVAGAVVADLLVTWSLCRAARLGEDQAAHVRRLSGRFVEEELREELK